MKRNSARVIDPNQNHVVVTNQSHVLVIDPNQNRVVVTNQSHVLAIDPNQSQNSIVNVLDVEEGAVTTVFAKSVE